MKTITRLCLAGSREWKNLFANAIFCWLLAYKHNVKVSNVYLERLTVAAAAYCLLSRILWHKNLNSKNSLPLAVIFAPFTQSIIVSLILSSNIGVLRYRNTPRTKHINDMEKNMLACLDDIPLIQIRRYSKSFFYFTILNFF